MKRSIESSFAFVFAMSCIGVGACGGNFTPSNSESGAGGGGGAAGSSSAAGSSGSNGVGGSERDAAVLIDGDDPRCPATPPAPYSACSSEQFICDYDDAGCPRRFTCITMGSVVAGAGVGGSFPGTSITVWISQSPMPGDSCASPGKICSYPDSYPSRLVCTEAREWEATTTPTTTTTTTEGTSTTTFSSSVYTAGSTTGGQGGTGNGSGTEGSGGAPSAADAGRD